MHTLEDIKKEFIDHLYGIDKSKLSINDLRVYADVLRIADEIERSNQPNKWMEMLATMSNCAIGPAYKPVDMKEV